LTTMERIVPWMHWTEWKQVREMLMSDDKKLQLKGIHRVSSLSESHAGFLFSSILAFWGCAGPDLGTAGEPPHFNRLHCHLL